MCEIKLHINSNIEKYLIATTFAFQFFIIIFLCLLNPPNYDINKNCGYNFAIPPNGNFQEREREREREKQFSFSEHLLLKLAYTNLYIIEKNNNRIRKQIIWTHQAEPKTNNATILSKL